MTSLIAPSKDLTRKAAFAARKRAHAHEVDAAMALRDHFMASRLHTGARIISGYCPIRTEIDPIPLMTALSDAGHTLCVPVIVGAGQPLRFHVWTPDGAMQDGPFGASVPVDTNEVSPDLLLVPMLAYDLAGWRLGYGGGFYDRTLEGLRARGRTIAVGVAYSAQQIERVPTEPTDQRLDAILTERGFQRPVQRAGVP